MTGLKSVLDAEGMESILFAQAELKDKARLDAYINVLVEANPEILKEVIKMSTSKTVLQQILRESYLWEEVENETKKNILFKVAESMMADEESIEKISKHTDIPVNELIDYFKLSKN